MRISDWSSDVCSSDLNDAIRSRTDTGAGARGLYLAAVLEPRGLRESGRSAPSDPGHAARTGETHPHPTLPLKGRAQEQRQGMFNKILIANRGAIACRVIRTAPRPAITPVAGYTEAHGRPESS